MCFWTFSDQTIFSLLFERGDASEFRTHKVFRLEPDWANTAHYIVPKLCGKDQKIFFKFFSCQDLKGTVGCNNTYFP